MNARVFTRAFAFQRRRFLAIAAIVTAIVTAMAACKERDAQSPAASERSAQPAARDSLASGGEVAPPDTSRLGNDAAWITDANALAILDAMNARQIAAADVELEGWHTD
ncbi:MAG: hypothetical protein ACREPM_26095, partial [Gemmatimonadaceae bacterium]